MHLADGAACRDHPGSTVLFRTNPGGRVYPVHSGCNR